MHLNAPNMKKSIFSQELWSAVANPQLVGGDGTGVRSQESEVRRSKRSGGRRSSEEGLFALEEGGMGIVKAAVEGMGGEVGEVFLVEFAQGADEGAGFVHGLGGVGVGLVFVPA